MDEKSKIQMKAYYSNLLHKYGDSVEAMAYKNSELQKKRFSLMADINFIECKGSVLDIGCGLGYLCEFLRKYGWQGRYTGVDIEPDMINTARKRLPQDNFICKDILTEEFNEKYDYVFCGATLQHKPKCVDSEDYLKEMVKKMFSLTNKVLVFDVFSCRVDYLDKDKLYVSPVWLLNFCYTLTTRAVLRNDQRPYEIMVYLYKEVDRDDFNVYRDWVPSVPKVV